MITFLVIIVVIIGIAILLNRYLNKPKQQFQEMVSDNLENNLEVVMNNCPNCKIELLKEVRFCPDCGIDLSTVSKPAPSSKTTQPNFNCPQCQALIKLESKFCPNCGFDLAILAEQAPKSEATQSISRNKEKGEFIKNLLFWIVLIFLGLFVYTIITNEPEEKKSYEVTLMVTGNSEALITYTNSSGGIEQINGAGLPWGVKYLCTGNHIFSLSAQAQSYNSAIEVKILVNGKEIKSSKSQGDFVVASTVANISD